MFKITGLCRGPPRWSSLPGSAVHAGTVLAPGSAVFTPGCTVLTPGCTVSLSLPLYRFSAGVYRVGCGLGHGLGRDNHLLARHLLFFSSFRHFLWNCRRCWRFSDQVDNDLKSKKCFLIGIRISPGSTVLTSGWRRGLPCRHRGLPCWHRGVPGSTVFTPVWCQSLSCRYRGLSCWYRGVPGSTVFVPGWRRGLPCLRRGDGPRGDRRCDFIYTLLAKKLCDSSFLNQNLDWINSHFKTDRVMSFIF